MDKNRFEFALRLARRAMPDFERGWVMGYICAADMEEWQREYVRNVTWARARGISA